MASTTYDRFVGVNKMYAVQEQFRYLTKMVCDFVKVNKIDHFAVIGNMVRNAGQLPQPFWLGSAHGGGSCGFPASVARA